MLAVDVFGGDTPELPWQPLLAATLLAGVLLAVPSARADSRSAPAATPQAAGSGKTVAVLSRSHRAEMWNAASFGVDQMQLRSVSSGASIEFRYRVRDADKAAVFTDRKATPYLIDPETGTRLQVPVMEKIGALRQTTTPQVGREYWMIFANPGKAVKPGRRVELVCGTFHIRGLIVE